MFTLIPYFSNFLRIGEVFLPLTLITILGNTVPRYTALVTAIAGYSHYMDQLKLFNVLELEISGGRDYSFHISVIPSPVVNIYIRDYTKFEGTKYLKLCHLGF